MKCLRRLCRGTRRQQLRPRRLPLGTVRDMSQPSQLLLAALLAALLLGACGLPPATPMWGPSSPRNGATQPVDPVYGTPIPGYPQMNDD
jgi:hypothetical protein